MTISCAGSIVALVTPFEAGGERIDRAAWRRLVEWHIEAGTDGIVVAGTTGESAALDAGERDWLLESALETAAGRCTVLAGTGAPSTAAAVALSRRAAQLGADAVLVVAPYYNRPPQRGLVAHYLAIADSVEAPVILYNVPSRTASDIQPETALALAAHENVLAIKEAVADMARVARYAEAGLDVLSGDDPTALEAMRHGAKGVISVAANVAPAPMSRMCGLAADGDFEAAAEIDAQLKPLYRFLGVESNPIPAKWLLSASGRIGRDLRLPLVELDESHHAAGRRLLESLEVE
ncbi:MAG: 4-hydroxy-tetrahydrodipicolinate synthase [Xanthomonadales bacterium]|nr:4-hydroxy-tetrahydrodipicolinate synthase [Xanthomonadales bacterium]